MCVPAPPTLACRRCDIAQQPPYPPTPAARPQGLHGENGLRGCWATAAAAAEFGAKSLAAAAAAAAAGGDFNCPFDGCGAVTAVVAAAVEVARAGTMYTRCQRCDRTFALTLALARALAVTLTLTLPLTPTLFPP